MRIWLIVGIFYVGCTFSSTPSIGTPGVAASGLAAAQTLTPRGTVPTSGYASALDLARQTLYLVAGGLASLDVGDLDNPRVGGVAATPGGAATDVALSGPYVFVADDTAGVLVFDVRDPAAPQLRATYPGGRAYAITIEGTRLYVAGAGNGLRVFDITNPVSPVLLGAYRGTFRQDDLSFDVYSFAVAQHVAYLSATYYDGGQSRNVFEIVSFSEPAQPTQLGVIQLGRYIVLGGLAVQGDYVYAFSNYDLTATFRTIDVRDRLRPQTVGRYEFGPASITSLEVVGGLALVGTFDWTTERAGLSFLDVTTPTAPVLSAAFAPLGFQRRVIDTRFANGTLYVSTQEGLKIFSVNYPYRMYLPMAPTG